MVLQTDRAIQSVCDKKGLSEQLECVREQRAWKQNCQDTASLTFVLSLSLSPLLESPPPSLLVWSEFRFIPKQSALIQGERGGPQTHRCQTAQAWLTPGLCHAALGVLQHRSLWGAPATWPLAPAAARSASPLGPALRLLLLLLLPGVYPPRRPAA